MLGLATLHLERDYTYLFIYFILIYLWLNILQIIFKMPMVIRLRVIPNYIPGLPIQILAWGRGKGLMWGDWHMIHNKIIIYTIKGVQTFYNEVYLD